MMDNELHCLEGAGPRVQFEIRRIGLVLVYPGIRSGGAFSLLGAVDRFVDRLILEKQRLLRSD